MSSASILVVLRRLLALVSALAVAWAAVRVARRDLLSGDAGSERVVLTVMHWSGDAGQEEDRIVEDALRAYEQAHPGVRVERINPGDAGSFYTKLQTMMAAGTPPDVFYCGDERLPSLASMGVLRPLDDLIEVDREQGRGAGLDDFYPVVLDAYRWDGERTGAGPLYGLPKDFTTIGFYYNKDLFRQAGVPEPSDDWTWDEFLTAARSVASLDGCTGAEFVTWPRMLRLYLATQGCDVLAEDGSTQIGRAHV